jgi:hypothetical protein
MPPNATTRNTDGNSRYVISVLALYGFLDGLNLTSSNLRLVFDVLYNNNTNASAYAMHEWMLSDEGIEILVGVSVVIIGLSLFANLISTSKNKNATARNLANLQAILRDLSKSLKNAYKGIRSALLALIVFAGQDLRFLIIPIGLSLGLLSALNRIFYRQLDGARKDLMQLNSTCSLNAIEQTIDDACFVHRLQSLPAHLEPFLYSYILVQESESSPPRLYFIEKKINAQSKKPQIKPTEINIGTHQLQTITQDLSIIMNDDEPSKLLSSDQIRKAITLNTSEYTFCLYTAGMVMERNTLYLYMVDNLLHYHAIAPNGEIVTQAVLPGAGNNYYSIDHPLTIEQINYNIQQHILETASKKHHLYLGHTPLQKFHAQVMHQKDSQRYLGFLSKAYSGIVDGLYLYMGAAILTTLTPQLFIFVAALSLIFSLTCIATRLYEEHCKQRQFYINEIDAHLVICGKELEFLLIALDTNNREESAALGTPTFTPSFEANHIRLVNALRIKMDEFNTYKIALRKKNTLSSSEAILEGLVNGLAIYGVVAAMMFSLSTIALIGSIAFPPLIVVACAAIGLGFLLGFAAYSFLCNLGQTTQQQQTYNEQDTQLHELHQQVKNRTEIDNIEARAKTVVALGKKLSTEKPSNIPNIAEVARSGSAAIGKGPKATEFTCGALQTLGSDGRLHDSPFMMGIMVLITPIYAWVLGSSAYIERFAQKKIPPDRRPPPPPPSAGHNRHSLFNTRPPSVSTSYYPNPLSSNLGYDFPGRSQSSSQLTPDDSFASPGRSSSPSRHTPILHAVREDDDDILAETNNAFF